ncbi:MAG: hypothetical protein WC955_03970 [Elusimicrobiota bacterium]
MNVLDKHKVRKVLVNCRKKVMAMESISSRNKCVLFDTFGVGTGKFRTYKEVSSTYKVSPRRIRSICVDALQKVQRMRNRTVREVWVKVV